MLEKLVAKEVESFTGLTYDFNSRFLVLANYIVPSFECAQPLHTVAHLDNFEKVLLKFGLHNKPNRRDDFTGVNLR